MDKDYTIDPLWEKIDTYSFDTFGAEQLFEKTLAKEHKWTGLFTDNVVKEYKRFIYLCCISKDGLMPSKMVDEAWQLHLTGSTDYKENFCGNTIGKEIPYTAFSDKMNERRVSKQVYANTLKLYENTFGEQPPHDIWKIPKQKEFPDGTIARNMFLKSGSQAIYLLLALPFILIALVYKQPDPLLLTTNAFALFYVLLVGITIFILVYSHKRKIKKLEAVLEIVYPCLNKYELAFLTGGKARFATMCFCDLLQCGYLTYRNNQGTYIINKNAIAGRDNPAIGYFNEFKDGASYLITETAYLLRLS